MRKIVQLILAVAIVALIYVVYSLIATPIKFENEKKQREAVVIERIQNIRTAQRAYKAKYQRFTGDFDTLTAFVLNETIEGERKIVDEDDSVAMAMLKQQGKQNVEKFSVAVIDTIFAPKKLTPDEVKALRYVPFSDKKEFIMSAGIFQTESKIKVPVVECKAPYKMFLDTTEYRQEIINLIDDQVNNFNRYPGIKFGSMDNANNEAGNWE